MHGWSWMVMGGLTLTLDVSIMVRESFELGVGGWLVAVRIIMSSRFGTWDFGIGLGLDNIKSIWRWNRLTQGYCNTS